MKNRVWINIVMAILVAGLFLTVSCAKKTVVSDATTIEDQAKAKLEADAKAAAEAAVRAKAEADRIAQQKLEDEKAQKAAQFLAAKEIFENQDIYFDYDSSELSEMAKSGLKEKAAWLKDNSSSIITIEGHCDERGTTEYNLALGDRRANTAKSYLVNLGIAASRLNSISYGEEKPKDEGKTESAYSNNRRAHFVID